MKTVAMKTLLRYSFLLIGCVSLIGCSYFDKDEVSLDNKPSAESIDLTNQQGAMTLQPPPSMKDMISLNTHGSVEIFPLNEPVSGSAMQGAYSMNQPIQTVQPMNNDGAMPVETVPAVPVDAMGGPVTTHHAFSNDPSVDVFPLDGPISTRATSQTAISTWTPPSYDDVKIVNSSTGKPAVIYFEHNSTALDDGDRQEIANLVANNNIARGISVEGFASTQSTIEDPVMRKIANLKVSMERAISVSRALIEKGVPAELVTTVAHGETEQAATPEQSRRVEIRGL